MRSLLVAASFPPLLLLGLLRAEGCPGDAPTPTSAALRDAGAAPPSGPGSPPDAGRPAPGPCQTDDDCAITRVPQGGCCEGCAPRAVTRAELEAIAAQQAGCREQGKRCPAPACASPRLGPRAACEAGRCVLHLEPLDSQ